MGVEAVSGLAGYAIPRCCAGHRLAALDAIGDLLAVDAYLAVTEMIELGWSADDALVSFRSWLLARFSEAIDIGGLLGEAKAGAEIEGRCLTCQAAISEGRCWGCGGSPA